MVTAGHGHGHHGHDNLGHDNHDHDNHDHDNHGHDPAAPPSDPCERLAVRSADGARLVACAYGGHVLSWTPAGSGHDRLWVSERAVCGGGAAIRGGIPVIFPQFSDRGPLPKHGVARDRPWLLHRAGESGDGAAVLTFLLADDADTRATWPAGFALSVEARAGGNRLDVTLRARNTGAAPWDFTAALHTYLRVSSTAAATLDGLAGHPAEDNRAGRAEFTVPVGRWAAAGPYDAVIRDVRGPVVLDDPVLGRLTMAGPAGADGAGFADVVVWNPGPGHGLADVVDGAEQKFVCVEPATVTPTTLAPGGSWTGRLTLLDG